MVDIAILGHGVVGSGVAELLINNGAGIAKRAGNEIRVKHILDLRDFSACPYKEKFTKDFNVILNDPDIQVVVEAMGGIHPAYDFAKACLEAGKSVVTSNKEVVAAKGAELLATAEKNNVNFLFEASVGGGIPVIRPLHQSLSANEIEEITGILNGTTNFILTKMIKEDMSFEKALKLAQELGYAEANPSADVDGHDTCRKICILASIAFGEHVYPEFVPTEGIGNVTHEDVQYAENAGAVIKLIGQVRRPVDGKIFILTGPAFVPKDNRLSSVDDVFNAVMVRGDATGDVVFYGKGAGKFPTASAMIGDVIDCITSASKIPTLHWVDSGTNNVAYIKSEPMVMYVRCKGDAQKAEKEFGGVRLLHRPQQPEDEIAFIIPPMPEREIEARLQKAGLVSITKIRVLTK